MKKFLISCMVVILFVMKLQAQNQLSKNIGNIKEAHQEPDGITIIADNATIKITAYTSTIIRIRVAKEKFANDFSYSVIQQPNGKYTDFNDNDSIMSISTESINIVINKKPLRIKFYNKKNQLLNEDYKDFGISWIGNEVTCYKKLFPDEKFIGLGEKTGPLNRRGQAYKNWNSDVPAYGIEEDPLYASIPFYIGIHNKLVYGIFLDNTFKTSFNFGASTDDKMSSFSVADGELNYYFFGSGSIEQIIRDYTYLTGHAQLPPLWSLGYQQCRWSYYPDKEVLSLAKNFRDKKIPADVIYLDIHHMQDYKVFTFNSEYFPKPDELISELNKMGFHVVAIVDPGLKIEKGYSAYDEGLANNCFIKYPNGDCYTGSVWAGRSNFPDFTNPKVRDWWGNLFTNYITPGVEGFWNDMNEPAVWGQNIPDIVEFDYDGNRTTMKQAHNIYGMQMSRSTYEGTRKLMNGKRPLVITRATFSGGQRYSTIWTGDNLASDEHMLLGVRIVNSLGICGFPFAGPDIGGFVGEPSRDLIMRWLSLGVYTPFMRNHASYNSNNHEPWTFGKDYEAIAREYINQRYRLLPYIYSAFYQATQTGIPVARTLAIKYTFDEKIYQHEYENEYLFGDNILVAPVVCDQQFEKVFLPEGEWYRISTDEYYKGSNEIIVSSPISDLPVFAKGSAIIPMQSVTQYTSEQPDSILYLHVYKGSDENSFFYYEDDGITYNFENGNCYRRMIYYRPKMKEIVLASKEGIFRSKFRKIKLILHNFDNISKIKIGKESLDVSKEKNTQVIVTDLNNEAIVFKW